MGNGVVLVVDDDELVRWSLTERLQAEGYDVIQAADGQQARAGFDRGTDVVLLDYRLPDVDGLTLLAYMKQTEPDTPVLLLTAHASVEVAVEAMRAGAYHYLCKPFELDEVAITVERALEATRLQRELRSLRRSGPRAARIVGQSAAISEARELLIKIASSPASTVLITGESGTGKDLAAKLIHARSDRRGGPFLNITCSALPATLLESELFGHEPGAFTDARTRKKGLLEHASGGTVFLDEIGEMEPAVQSKLLHFLDEKSFRRVGGTTDVGADVRVVAATNADLRLAVQRNTFRRDLYYRLAVLTVVMPPLREREGDIELLTEYFVAEYNCEFKRHVRRVSPDAMRLLCEYAWPGNVRELRNAVERAVLLAEGDEIEADAFSMIRHVAGATSETRFVLPPGGIELAAVERTLVEQALERCRGNRTRAAALLGLTRDQIRYRLEKFGLEQFRHPEHN